MFTPVILATWISVCLPMADPVLAHALVAAGSQGEPLTVMDASGQKLPGGKEAELVAALLAAPADQELYVGLAQIPRSSLKLLGIPADMALEPCTNLQVGYQLFSDARTYAATVEKTPKKLLAVSFNWYRNRQRMIDSPYATRATEAVEKPKFSFPAPFGSRLYMSISAQATASTARLLMLRSAALHQAGSEITRTSLLRLNSLY